MYYTKCIIQNVYLIVLRFQLNEKNNLTRLIRNFKLLIYANDSTVFK